MKNLKLTLTLGATLLLLAGCGATSTTDKNSSATSNQRTEAASSNSEPTYKFGEDLMKNERIIYQLHIGSETEAGIQTPVYCVYYFNKGKVTTYNTYVSEDAESSDFKQVVLGDFKGLDNKQIIDKLVKLLKKQDLKEIPQTHASIAKGQMMKYVKGTPQSIKISAVTDSTGNNIQSEEITASAKANFGLQIDSVPLFNSDDGRPTLDDNGEPAYSAAVLPHDEKNDLKLTLSTLSGATFTAYDKQYMILDNAEDERYYYYATEFNGTSIPVFDSIDDNYVTVSTPK